MRFILPVAEEGDVKNKDVSLIYRAPELSVAPTSKHPHPSRPTAASDIFSLAVVMYEVLSRATIAPPEWSCQGLLDYHRRVAGGFREPFKEGWPAEVKTLVAQAWSQRPEERPSAAEIAEKLAPLLGSNKVLAALTFPDGLMPKDQGCCVIS